jgi:spore maturation protein CgeB
VRIFYASENGPISGSRLWHNNLFLPLIDLGHEVLQFDFPLDAYNAHIKGESAIVRSFIRKNQPQLERALLSQIESAHHEKPIDLFFSYFWNPHCRPETIRRIRDMGIVTMNWYCNASYQFHLVSEIAPAYDFCLVPERFRLDDYRRVGAHPIYTQEAANPKIYKPYTLPCEYDVVFVGQMYGDRADYVRALLEAEIDVRVWGRNWPWRQAGLEGWMRRSLLWRSASMIKQRIEKGKRPYAMAYVPQGICGPPLSDLEMVKMYSRSKISLGFSKVGETHRGGNPIKQVRLRDFEAPMSGAFYLTEYVQELEDFFDIGKEIVCFSDMDDLVEKTHYYLSHDDERENIRSAGLQRALRDHTWQKRLSHALEIAKA